jgi:DNA-binding response OmpR family regulator
MSTTKAKIMLVDDEPDILAVFKKGLEIRGYSVDAFEKSRRLWKTFSNRSTTV